MKIVNQHKYWLLALLTLLSVGAWAQQKNVLSVPDAKVSIGQAQLPVAIENTDEIIAAQFDLTLPSTISAGTVATVTNRCDGHEVIIRKMEATRYRVMLRSDENRALIAQQGTVFYIPLTIPQTVAEGSELPLVISNATLIVAGGANVLTDTKAGKLIVSKLPDLTVTSVAAESKNITPGERLSLSWQVKNVGGTETGDGWSEQILLVNKRGTVTKLIGTVYQQETLAAGAVMSRQADITVPQLLGIEGEAYIQVKVIANSETGESALATGNNIAQCDETFTVAKRLFVEPNPATVTENYGRSIAVKVSRSGDWSGEQTFELSVSEDSRVTLPTQVTVPVGQSGAIVYMTVTDNQVLDENSVVVITAKGNNYPDATGQLVIEDNEYPNLTLTASKSEITEGETFQLTVTTSRVSSQPIEVTLISENTKRFSFPQTMTIPAGETSATVEVTAIEDELPSLELSNAFTALAPKYNKAEAVVLLKDNDMPVLELAITPITLSESAGPVAMMAVLRRTTHKDQDITVKLSDDSSGHDIYYGQFSTISMPKGVEEVTFNLGINDNLLVDGDRDVTITAAVYIQSCSCSAGGQDAGIVSQAVHIIDNDGPSLTLTSSRSMILEGSDEGTLLTISRNTSVTNSLMVSITSSSDESLDYQHSVVIPAGERTVKTLVKALANMNENDNNTIVFTAKAEGHNQGTCWVMVSDQTLPDARIRSIQLLMKDGTPIGEEGVIVNDWLQAVITIENAGVVDLPAGTAVNIYQNSRPYTSLITSQSVAPGESVTLTCNVKVTDQVGTINIFAIVNEDKATRELLYANNTSATVSVNALASFLAMVNVDKSILLYGDSVTITGHLRHPNGTAWEGEDKTTVVLYIIADGQRLTEGVTANADGEFSYVWKPARYQMGHIGIGACYPGELLREEMASVDIYGMRHQSSASITLDNIINEPLSGKFSIVNPGRLPLTGLTVSVSENADEGEVILDAPQRIEGGETVDIKYTLTSRKMGSGNDWQTVKLNMTTNEGAVLSKTIYYYSRNLEAQLSCSVRQINTTMSKGSTRDYMFQISNIGKGNTGGVSLSLPDWMQSVTPKNMASMAQGDTTQVIIRFVPTDDMPVNVPVTGQIGINCENGNGLAIPFSIEPVSESTGNLIVDVCDEYTYYTQEAPHVSGATVSILHPTTGAVIASDTTSVDGLFAITLPEGYYTLVVTHPNHNGYRANILIDPGKTTNKVINLIIDAIQVSWDVVETTVKDTYEIVTTVKYETNVPAPVVLVSVPDYIPAKELADGESLVFYAALTNVGLITAKDVVFDMPTDFKVLTYEPLDYVDEPFDLAPQQSVFIPVKVTNSTGMAAPSRMMVEGVKPVDNDPCYAQFPLSWFYECGTDSVYHKYPTGIRVGKCEEKPSGPVGGGSYGGFGGAGGWGSGGGGGRPTPGKYFTTINYDYVKPVVSTGEPYKCSPCSNSAFISLAKVFGLGPFFKGVETAKDIINCANSVVNSENWHDRFAGCKYTEKIVNSFDKAADKIMETYEDYLGLGNDVSVLKDHVESSSEFSKQHLDDLKNVCDSYYELNDDLDDLSEMGEKLEKNLETVDGYATKIQKEYESLKETRDIVEDDRYRWDIETSPLITPHKNEDYERLQKEIDESLKSDIATEQDYYDLLQATHNMVIDGKKPTREETRKLTRAGIKVIGDLAYNINKIPGMSEPLSATEDAIVKNAALETTNKLLEKADDIGDLLHYTFGDCEFEGPGEGGEEPAGGDEIAGSRSPRKAMSVRFNELPYSYKLLLDKLDTAREFLQNLKEMENEFFGSPEWSSLTDFQMASVAWAMEKVKADERAVDNPKIGIYCPEGITDEAFHQFLERYSNTVKKNQAASRRQKAPAENNVIDLQRIEKLGQSMEQQLIELTKGETGSVSEVLQKYYDNAYNDLSGRSNTVCASITLQFNQTMTMTRQAFRGTLTVHNGNPSESMKDVILQLEVRRATDGNLATSHEMQISAESLSGFVGPLNLTDGWTLAPNGDGTATILFIPSKYAAPTEPIDYTFGGRLVYLDPFTGLEVTRELSPVTLTVKPSPELDLTYFMQRDVYGDDPLTEDVIEPMKEAEFALLINNKGYGDATNVRMVTQQPEIIDNEKGLLINFELVSSHLNVGDMNLSFGKAIANDFGTIPAHSQMYAQWWLTSTLLGHFVDYKVEATHVTSYGNEDLSLLDQVTIHELIHGFDYPTGSVSGGLPTGRAFLVNDIADANDLPDKLYFTNGDTTSVAIAATTQIVRKSNTECELTITPSAAGWNYGNVYDPTHGYAELKSIVRKSDGKELGSTRFWQTDRTLRDGKDWLYEYRLHFVDEFATGGAQTYVLTFDPVPETVLAVKSIGPVPAEGEIAEEPIETLTVDFNKEIDATTFTGDDITFAVQGVKKNANQIGISTEDNKRFTLDMSTMNDTLPNGYYTMTVQTADITDAEGYKGKVGKQTSWILFRGGLIVLNTAVWPAKSGNIDFSFDKPAGTRRAEANDDVDDSTAKYGSIITFTATPDEGYQFLNWTLNGEVVSTDPTYTVTALSDMNVVANFSSLPILVEVEESEGGHIEGLGTGIYEHHAKLTLTAVADEDYVLKEWIINGEPADETGETLTLTVDAPMTIKAVFEHEFYRQTMTLARGWNWVSSYISEAWPVDYMKSYTNRIVGQFDELISDPQFGLVGGLEQMASGVAYKVEALERFSTSFRGHLLAAPITLKKGWNWVAYPWTDSRLVSAAITNAEEGDYLVSQRGFTEYADGYWEGSLRTLTPGEGYMYKAASDKTLGYDFTAAAARRESSSSDYANARTASSDYSDTSFLNSFPSTMSITARLYKDGMELSGDNYLLYAMNDNELRGVGEFVGSNYYITVYGDLPVDISFIVENATTGETILANEHLTFRDDVVGSRKQPFAISIGEATGIAEIENGRLKMDNYLYDLQGRKVNLQSSMFNGQSRKGVYIVNGHKVINGKYVNK